MEFSQQSIKFKSEALEDENALLVTKLVGTERLSDLFRFELELVSKQKDVPLEDVLYAPAEVAIAQGGGAGGKVFRPFAGVLARFEVAEQGEDWTTYHAVLVPDLADLRRFHRSRIFMDKTVDEIVSDVIEKAVGLQKGEQFKFELAEGPGGEETSDVYPRREYVVQYEETDYDFVRRWLAREGIFFFFDNDGTQEIVRFGDATAAYRELPGGEKRFPYRPEGLAEEADTIVKQEIVEFRCAVERRPKEVTLNDYNWRDPAVRLEGKADVHEKGIGLWKEYNDHFKTVGQGQALAKVRAAEWSCREKVFRGRGSVQSFRPGRIFELTEHFRADFNAEYLLTSVVHEAEQSVNLKTSPSVTGGRYHNTFEAIPATVVYRPPREAPWPAIKGVMNARVDAEGDGMYAELDELGRYKISIPFDENFVDATPGRASRWVRMAQPYAGVDSGMHFPLLKGTEVLLVHIDGDPDRPVIAGAVPNPETASPVDSANGRQNRIVTTSGNMMLVDDDEDGAGFCFVDANCKYVDDYRQPTSGHKGPGGGVGAGRAPGADLPSEAVRRVMAAGRELPPHVAARLQPGLGSSEYSGDGVSAENVSAFTAFYQSSDETGVIDDGIGALSGSNGPEGASAPIDDYDATQLRDFGDARLRVWLGDDIWVRKGNKFLYADVTHDISFGTGGDSYHREDGDTDDETEHFGNAKSKTTHMGDTESESFKQGSISTKDFKISATDYVDISMDTSLGFTYVLGGQTDTSLKGGIFNTIALELSAKATIDIGLSKRSSIQIDGFNNDVLKMGAGCDTEITLFGMGRSEVKLPKTTELTLEKAEAQLKSMKNELQGTNNQLAETNNKLSETSNKLSETENKLSDTNNSLTETNNKLTETENKLSETQNKLNETQNKLKETSNALQNQETCLNVTTTAVVIMLN